MTPRCTRPPSAVSFKIGSKNKAKPLQATKPLSSDWPHCGHVSRLTWRVSTSATPTEPLVSLSVSSYSVVRFPNFVFGRTRTVEQTCTLATLGPPVSITMGEHSNAFQAGGVTHSEEHFLPSWCVSRVASTRKQERVTCCADGGTVHIGGHLGKEIVLACVLSQCLNSSISGGVSNCASIGSASPCSVIEHWETASLHGVVLVWSDFVTTLGVVAVGSVAQSSPAGSITVTRCQKVTRGIRPCASFCSVFIESVGAFHDCVRRLPESRIVTGFDGCTWPFRVLVSWQHFLDGRSSCQIFSSLSNSLV